MTAEELFLFTLEELEDRLQFRRPEYDALSAAALLRKLMVDGQQSLIPLVSHGREVPPLTFAVQDIEPPPSLVGPVPLLPQDGDATRDLALEEFLDWTAVGVLGGGPGEIRPRPVQIRNLILFLANNYGAVHLSRPKSSTHRALWDFCWSASYITPNGQFSGGVYSVIDVAKVVLGGVEPLREVINSEAWPESFPKAARGSQRARDPRGYGFPSLGTDEPQ